MKSDPDFIVVGAGSAGCLLANRLTAEFGASVTLVEPASQQAPQIDRERPARWLHLLGSADDWNHATNPSEGLAGRALRWPRGRGIGGSSRINAMIWFPPTPEDLVNLDKATGGTWSSDRLRSAMSSIETILKPQDPRWLSESSTAFLKSARKFADGKPIAYKRLQNLGRRRSLADLIQATEHSNIELVRATANRILWNGETAHGVELKTESETVTRIARKGVILAAGSIATPGILIRSGFGLNEDLKTLGIDTRFESTDIGKHLQDHLIMPVIFRLRNGVDIFSTRSDPRSLAKWQHLGTGPLASNLAEVGGLFLNNTIQLHVTPTHYLSFPKEDPSAWLSIGISLTQPQSRGELKLTSRCPDSQPEITTGYLHDPKDLQEMIGGVQFIRDLANDANLQSIIDLEVLPGKRRESESAVSKSIQRYAQTLYHPVGTCRAGEDKNSVVDANFSVRGANRLWIADGSILPQISVGNPNATIMSLAWIAAETIAGAVESSS